MTKYREMLRLKGLGISERNIALSCNVSRNTVSKVTKKADEMNFLWPLPENLTDADIEGMLFPKEKSATNKRIPTSQRSLCATALPKSCYGLNTVRTAV